MFFVFLQGRFFSARPRGLETEAMSPTVDHSIWVEWVVE